MKNKQTKNHQNTTQNKNSNKLIVKNEKGQVISWLTFNTELKSLNMKKWDTWTVIYSFMTCLCVAGNVLVCILCAYLLALLTLWLLPVQENWWVSLWLFFLHFTVPFVISPRGNSGHFPRPTSFQMSLSIVKWLTICAELVHFTETRFKVKHILSSFLLFCCQKDAKSAL